MSIREKIEARESEIREKDIRGIRAQYLMTVLTSITDLEKRQSDRIALFGVIATIVIGVTQIIIALWK